MHVTHSHAQSGHTETFSFGNLSYTRSAPYPRRPSPPMWMPLAHTAHKLDVIFRHLLRIAASGKVPLILYPWHLLHLCRPWILVLVVALGHLHSLWNIFLTFVHSGRPLPQSSIFQLNWGTPWLLSAVSILLCFTLVANGASVGSVCTAIWFVGIFKLSFRT